MAPFYQHTFWILCIPLISSIPCIHLTTYLIYPIHPIFLCLQFCFVCIPFHRLVLSILCFPDILIAFPSFLNLSYVTHLSFFIRVKNLSLRSCLYHLSCLSNVSYPSYLSLFLRLCNLSYLPFIPFILCITIFLTIQFRTYLVYPFDPTYATYPTYLLLLIPLVLSLHLVAPLILFALLVQLISCILFYPLIKSVLCIKPIRFVQRIFHVSSRFSFDQAYQI